MADQGYPAPGPSQVDRAEGDDPQSPGLDQDQDHDPAHCTIGRCVDSDEPCDADG